MIVKSAASRAAFSLEKMGKVSLGAGAHLYAGLNCLLPGQEHSPHVHGDQDKMYLVLEGTGLASCGGEQAAVGPGDLVLAPAGMPHGLKNTGDVNLVALVVFSPPPAKS
jgi:mannose-6-phosphate isomerase-like protein (cupin superfamily)